MFFFLSLSQTHPSIWTKIYTQNIFHFIKFYSMKYHRILLFICSRFICACVCFVVVVIIWKKEPAIEGNQVKKKLHLTGVFDVLKSIWIHRLQYTMQFYCGLHLQTVAANATDDDDDILWICWTSHRIQCNDCLLACLHVHCVYDACTGGRKKKENEKWRKKNPKGTKMKSTKKKEWNVVGVQLVAYK